MLKSNCIYSEKTLQKLKKTGKFDGISLRKCCKKSTKIFQISKNNGKYCELFWSKLKKREKFVGIYLTKKLMQKKLVPASTRNF